MGQRRDNVRRLMSSYERSWHRCDVHRPIAIEWANPATARMTTECVGCGKRQVSESNVREALNLDHVLTEADREHFARAFMACETLGGARA